MRIYDGREFFYQWDTGQKIAGVFKAGEEVHVSCSCSSAALPVIAYELGGLIVADVPDSMLQRAGVLNAYIMRTDSSGRSTKEEFSFVINPRKKPADYVYTPTEAQTYEALEKRIEALEQNGGSGGTDKLNVTFTDQTTGKRYSLYVESGKLMMDETFEDASTESYITFEDEKTNKNYRLYVDDGKLTMSEVL